MKTHGLTTQIRAKKPKNVRNCESWVNHRGHRGPQESRNRSHREMLRRHALYRPQVETGVVAINSSVFCNEASSSTFQHFFERSIWRISPHSTFPGPTSTNV